MDERKDSRWGDGFISSEMTEKRNQHGRNATVKLKRETFRTSRMMDFCNRKELTAQTGHPPDLWPLVILKELVDNALDACEEGGVAPAIQVRADDDGITVTDNGPGISVDTVRAVLDFNIRVSSREAYVSPTRGAQGNALKTIIAMPFAIDGNQGRVDITAGGVRHEISFAFDQIRQEPIVSIDPKHDESNAGTRVMVHWPNLAKLNARGGCAIFTNCI